MAKQKFVHFVPRDKPPKLGPGRHKKNLNKSEKRMKKKSSTLQMKDQLNISDARILPIANLVIACLQTVNNILRNTGSINEFTKKNRHLEIFMLLKKLLNK